MINSLPLSFLSPNAAGEMEVVYCPTPKDLGMRREIRVNDMVLNALRFDC
jgi:hypothetical protein